MFIVCFFFSFLVNILKFEVVFVFFGIMGIDLNCCDVAGLIVYV